MYSCCARIFLYSSFIEIILVVFCLLLTVSIILLQKDNSYIQQQWLSLLIQFRCSCWFLFFFFFRKIHSFPLPTFFFSLHFSLLLAFFPQPFRVVRLPVSNTMNGPRSSVLLAKVEELRATDWVIALQEEVHVVHATIFIAISITYDIFVLNFHARNHASAHCWFFYVALFVWLFCRLIHLRKYWSGLLSY